MRCHWGIITDGYLVLCEVDLEGRINDSIPCRHDTSGSLLVGGAFSGPDAMKPRNPSVR